MFQIWADILKNVWFQEWVEFTDQLQDAHVIPIVSSTKYFTWASESQFPVLPEILQLQPLFAKLHSNNCCATRAAF